MKPQSRSLFLLALKLFLLSLFLSPFIGSAMALDELFDLYDSPQGLAMGNAFTADASGHSSNYYNPAGLAKASRRQWEIIPVAVEAVPSLKGVGRALSAKSLGIHQVAREMKKHPGDYYYSRFNAMPAVSRRNFAVTFLGSYQNAGRSDGTLYDANATVDVGTTVGAAASLAGNLLKVGIAGKFLMRNQLKGTFAHTDLATEDAVKERMKEGVGAGADLGMLVTFPAKYLPTFALAWKDALDTRFYYHSRILDGHASGLPDVIKQSVNTAFSIHPYAGRLLRSTVAFEVKHLERGDIALRKRLHIGFQLEDERSFYLWAGLNQLYWTAGAGLRVRGGNLEIGSYGEEVGTGSATQEDRRFFFRYTIGF